MLEVHWRGGLAFEGINEDGGAILMDTERENGGSGLSLSPLETLMCSAAACSAYDVVEILRKKHKTIDRYRVEIEHTRTAEGIYPRPLANLTLRHVLSGPDLDDAAVKRAVELSDQKYCTVVASLRSNVEVTSTFEII